MEPMNSLSVHPASFLAWIMIDEDENEEDEIQSLQGL